VGEATFFIRTQRFHRIAHRNFQYVLTDVMLRDDTMRIMPQQKQAEGVLCKRRAWF
jgi:hypothetical protein